MLGALLTMGGSLLSGLLGQSDEKKRLKAQEFARQQANVHNQQAIEAFNQRSEANANRLNAEIRKRADKAAKVPVVTQSSRHVTDTQVDTRHAETQSSVDIDGMMAAAEKAGFNPVTFLRAGGLQAYAKSVSDETGKHTQSLWEKSSQKVTGANAMDAALAGQHLPALMAYQEAGQDQSMNYPGTGEVLGSALKSGVDKFVSDLDQSRQNDFQRDLLERQLAGRNRSGVGGGSMYVPYGVQYGGTSNNGGSGALGGGGGVSLFGTAINPDKGTSDANDFENRYGELGDWVGGAAAALSDAYKFIQTHPEMVEKKTGVPQDWTGWVVNNSPDAMGKQIGEAARKAVMDWWNKQPGRDVGVKNSTTTDPLKDYTSPGWNW